MKTISLGILFFCYSAMSFACVTHNHLEFCVGDKAIFSDSDGTIVGVNKDKISIDFTGGSTKKSGVITVDIDHVFLGKGCFQDFCVGSFGVGDNLGGEIVGVNPSLNKIAINHKRASDKYSQIKLHLVKNSLVGKGCVDAYCTGDPAVFKTSDGTIVAVNGSQKSVAISFVGGTTKYKGIGTYDVKTVSVGKGCFAGFCFGDKAVSGSVDGRVVGVNPYRTQVSVMGSGIVTDSIKNTTMRSMSESFHANDSKRMISSLKEFNHGFGK